MTSWKLVTIDIDGTLTRVHGWRFLAESAGKLPTFEGTNQHYLSGEEGEDEHLRSLMDLATGLTAAEVADILQRTPRIQGIGATVTRLKELGAVVALLTHNPPYVCDWYRRRFAFDDFEGTAGSEIVDGHVRAPTGVHADKVEGMRRLLARHSVEPSAAVHIGDGPPDAAVFPYVGGGVALNTVWPKVRSSADAALDTDDIQELLPVLERIVPRHPV